jgi:hypothetical protein
MFVLQKHHQGTRSNQNHGTKKTMNKIMAVILLGVFLIGCSVPTSWEAADILERATEDCSTNGGINEFMQEAYNFYIRCNNGAKFTYPLSHL